MKKYKLTCPLYYHKYDFSEFDNTVDLNSEEHLNHSHWEKSTVNIINGIHVKSMEIENDSLIHVYIETDIDMLHYRNPIVDDVKISVSLLCKQTVVGDNINMIFANGILFYTDKMHDTDKNTIITIEEIQNEL